jgi:Dolichyl-phosphate-mannose-protein mannosyltransferase
MQTRVSVEVTQINSTAKSPKNSRFWLYLVFLFLNLAIIFGFYQTRPQFTVDIGATGDSTRISDFHAAEKTEQGSYRWTRSKSTVNLPAVGSPFRVTLEGTGFRPKELNLAPPTLKLSWDNAETGKSYPLSPQDAEFGEIKSYSLDVPELALNKPNGGNLTIASEVFQPNRSDDRSLGILVDRVQIQAFSAQNGFITPPLITWFSLSFALLGWQIILVRVLRGRLALVSSFAVSLLLVMAFWLAPSFMLLNALLFGVILGVVGLITLKFLPASSPLLPSLPDNNAALYLRLAWGGLFFGLALLLFFYLPLGWSRWLKLGAGIALALIIVAIAFGLTKLIPKLSQNKIWQSVTKAQAWVWVILGVGLALLPRLYRLGEPSFWLDEMFQYLEGTKTPEMLITTLVANHIPQGFYLTHLQLWLFPTRDEGSLRLSAVLFGVMLIPVIYALGKELFGRRVAIVSTFLAGFFPLLVIYSQEFRIYAPWTFVLAMATYFLLKAVHTGKIGFWFGFVVFAGSSFFMHFNSLFPIFTLGLFTACYFGINVFKDWQTSKDLRLVWHKHKQWLAYASGAWFIVGLAFLTLFLNFQRLLATAGVGVGRYSNQALSLDFDTLSTTFQRLMMGDEAKYQSAFLGWTVIILALVALITALFRTGWSALFCAMWLFTPFGLLSQVRGSVDILVSIRYLIFLAPVYLVLIGAGVIAVAEFASRLITGLTRQSKALQPYFQNILSFGLVLVLLIQMLQPLNAYYDYPRNPNIALRPAFSYLRANLQNDDVVFGLSDSRLGDSEWFETYFAYYVGDKQNKIPFLAISYDPTINASTIAMNQATKAKGRLWTIVAYSGDLKSLITLAGEGATGQCFTSICVISHPNPPNSNMTTRMKTFFQNYQFINPRVIEHFSKLLQKMA